MAQFLAWRWHMVGIRAKTLGRLSLIAAMLLSGATVPNVSHAHAGGAVEHRHSHAKPGKHRHHHASHSHGDGHSHLAGNSRHVAPAVASDGIRHQHVSWFGLEISLPAESGEGTSPPICVKELGITRAINAASPSYGFAPSFIGMVSDARPEIIAAQAGRATAHLHQSPCSQSLCHRARHERSGVQLS